MTTQDTAPAKAAAASVAAEAKDDAKDKPEIAAQEDDKVCIYNTSPTEKHVFTVPRQF